MVGAYIVKGAECRDMAKTIVSACYYLFSNLYTTSSHHSTLHLLRPHLTLIHQKSSPRPFRNVELA